MALINLERLYKVTSRGRTYYYAWRGGPRVMGEPGSREFLEEYHRHCDPLAALDRRKMGTWVALFKASPEYGGLSDDSKKDMGPKLDDLAREFGTLSVGAFDKPEIRGHIKRWRDKWRDTPRTADKAKGYLSRLCSFLIEEGVLATNPCEGIANIYKKNDRSEIIWTDDDIALFMGTKGVSQEIKWALQLAALTGLRQGALLELPWTRVEALCINMRGSKKAGKGRGTIPMYPALKALLDVMPRRALTVLTNESGEPWQAIGASWNKAMIRSGLKAKGLHFHDLRGTAATNFYRAGFTSREIAAIMGWKTEDVEKLLDIYVNRDALLVDKIRRMEQFEKNKREQA